MGLESLLMPADSPRDHKNRPRVFRRFNPHYYGQPATFYRGDDLFGTLHPDVRHDLRRTSSLYATFCFQKRSNTVDAKDAAHAKGQAGDNCPVETGNGNLSTQQVAVNQ